MRKFTDKIKEYTVNFMSFYERWEPLFTVALITLLLIDIII